MASSPLTYLIRVWLPDRPGALGAVAGRIGEVQCNVVGIDVIERGAGRAIDELVVEVPALELVDVLVRRINSLDGVDVEEVRPLDGHDADRWLDALDSASRLLGAATVQDLIVALCELAHRASDARWTVVTDLAGGSPLAALGDPPREAWLTAFVQGRRLVADASRATDRAAEPAAAAVASPAAEAAPTSVGTGLADVIWVALPGRNLALVLGREGSCFRPRERRHAAALARVADAWAGALADRSRLVHPSFAR